MKKYRMYLIGILIVLIGLTNVLYADTNKPYDNSAVYTTVGEEKYYADGAKLMKNKEVIADYSRMNFEDPGLGYTNEMAKTLLITDMAYSTQSDSIHISAVIFKVRNVDFDNTNQYWNGRVNIGTPYCILLKYSMTGNYTEIKGYSPVNPLWIAPFKTEFNEVDEEHTFQLTYNYASEFTLPKVIANKYDSNVMYYMIEEPEVGRDKVKRLKVYKYYIYSGEFFECFYVNYNYFTSLATENNLGEYAIDTNGFYIIETGKDKIAIINKGTKYSIKLEMDVSVYGKPKATAQQWMEN
jgi:hypothetical protein